MRRALLVFILAAGLGGAAAPASADVFAASNASTGVTLDPDGAYRVIVEHFADGSRNGSRIRQISFGDPAITTSGPECSRNPFFNDVVCEGVVSIVQVIAENDAPSELVVGGSNVGCEAGPPVRVLIRGGGGADIVRPLFGCGGEANVSGNNRYSPRFTGGGGSGNDTLTGGRLDDVLAGDAGSDAVAGGVGPDVLTGGSGNDTVTGQGGDDDLTGDGGADVLDGGGQVDTVRYPVTGAVTVTLDDAANDGASGEGDNVIDVETVITGDGNDNVTGSSAGETLQGGGGGDTLEPGGGTDTVFGNAGDDLIDVRVDDQGVRDVVNCGSGDDEVIADLQDSIAVTFSLTLTKGSTTACERVERFAVDDGPPGRIRARSVKLGRDGRAVVRLACPRRARVACRGTVRVADPRRLRRTLARGSYAVRRRATGAIRVRLSRAAARRARSRGAITFITRERGVSRKGPRSMIATLRVR